MDQLQNTSNRLHVPVVHVPVTAKQNLTFLHGLFEAQVDLRPDAPALICGNEALSYRELDHRANQLARHLQSFGAGPEKFVALYFDRSLHPIIAILACLKAGAAYVPIDPSYPDERIQHILAESEAIFLLSDCVLSAKAHGIFSGKVIDLDADAAEIARHSAGRLSRNDSGVSSKNLAYVIYTSGSTGRPKGVMAEHGSVCKYVLAFNEICGTRPDDRIYQGFSLAFDGSVEEIWMAFSNGSTLVLGDKHTPRFENELGRFLAQSGITYFSTVPTMLSTITEPIPSLRTLVVSGEICPPEIVNRWARPGLRMLNVYGPTEATVNTTAAECLPGKPVTIGRALSGYDLHILDAELRPVSRGEQGELFIGGDTLARGYLKQPELTSERFIAAPPWLANKQKRLYRTGDWVQYNDQGELDFFGRIDGQIKIRGYRVELAEIETILLEHEGIRSASVKLVECDGLQELAAYVALEDSSTGINRADLLLRLETRLPRYMIPGYLDVVEELPMLTSGKVDRSRLPAPVLPLVRTSNIVDPSNELETKLVSVWADLFKLPRISIESDFFLDLGGHSLAAAQMVTRVRATTRRHLTVRDAYDYPTVRRLARRLAELPEQPIGTQASSRTRFKATPRALRFTTSALQAVSSTLLYGIGILPLAALYLLNREWFAGRLSLAEMMAFGVAFQLALFPAMLLLSIAAKWVLIGKYKPGRYPLWGSYYLRWWLATRIQAMSGAGILAGSPLMSLYFRLMGARVGRGCTIDTSHCAIWDLVTIGDETSIGTDSQLLGYRVEDGMLILGSVAIGNRCFIGTHSALGLNVRMEDDSRLDDQSLLPDGQHMASGEMKQGSPARTAEVPVPKPGNGAFRHSAVFGLAHFAAIQLITLLLFVPALPISTLTVLAYQRGTISGLLALIAAVPVSFALYCVFIAALKRLLLNRIETGEYPVRSVLYLRKWSSDLLMRISRGMLLPLYTTLYFPAWLRLLGAKIGARAEISTVWNLSPELIDIGSESFFADGSIIGGKRIYRGQFQVAVNRIGRRTFVGNSAVLPVGSHLGDNSLLGVQSLSPQGTPANATEWLGSPAFSLPHRPKETRFNTTLTFLPTTKLYLQRALIDGIRILLPLYLLLLSAIGGFALLHFFMSHFGTVAMFLMVPVIGLLLSGALILAVVAVKKLVMGTYKPTVQPLWSMYVWLNEMVNGLYEYVMARAMAPILATPFAAPTLRLIGCRIGRHTFIETTLFSEFDLVEVSDYAALNAGSVVQTHLFEDRVMKSSYAKIGEESSVGNMAIVLYDAEIQNGGVIGPLSLLMKGETLPPHSRWHGIPVAQAGEHPTQKSTLPPLRLDPRRFRSPPRRPRDRTFDESISAPFRNVGPT